MTQVGTYRYGKNKVRLFRVTLPIAVAEVHQPPNENPYDYDFKYCYENGVSENISTEILTLDVWTGDKPAAIKKIRQLLEALLEKNY